jgi:hypothetical protein
MSDEAQRVVRLDPPPVFNCVVHLARRGDGGMIVARVANLAGIEAEGKTERDALARVVPAFKAAIAAQLAAGQEIPWIATPAAPAQGETQRLIAVHL